MSAGKRRQATRLAVRQHIARELQGVAVLLDRAVALMIETRADDDLDAFVSAMVAIRNAHVLVTGLAMELGAKGGAA